MKARIIIKWDIFQWDIFLINTAKLTICIANFFRVRPHLAEEVFVDWKKFPNDRLGAVLRRFSAVDKSHAMYVKTLENSHSNFSIADIICHRASTAAFHCVRERFFVPQVECRRTFDLRLKFLQKLEIEVGAVAVVP